MADKPKHSPDAPDVAEGAGTSPAPSDAKDARIAALEAQLAASQAQGVLAQIQQAQQPAPTATFAAPSAALIGKQDSLTGLVQQLPQKLWDQLSDEDAARFTVVPEQPEKPADLK